MCVTHFEREEVQAMCTILSAIEWPGDQLRVYGALRGPFFAIDDALLLEWKEEVGAFDPLAPRT